MPGVSVEGLDSAGGALISAGQSHVRINGAKVVVLGDPVTGHGNSPHSAPSMVQGSTFVTINGIPIVLAGHAASCGHTATGRPTVTASN